MNEDFLDIIVAVTGASGSVYARLLLDELRVFQSSGHVKRVSVVFSDKAKQVWEHEIGDSLENLPFTIYDNDDFRASFASGSSLYDAMIVCPCSMGTLGRIANGISDTLITRAADVALKERRRLILAIRETPIHIIHINNMQILSQAGAIIAPAAPSFYSRPRTIEEAAMTVVDRLLQLVGLQKETYRWSDGND